jgi:hypothetical protein
MDGHMNHTPNQGRAAGPWRTAVLALTAFAALAATGTSAGRALAAPTPDLPLIGRSAVVTNDVEGQLPTTPDRKKVVVNDDIFLNETMYTVSDSSMVVEFRDGSTLELGPDAVFTIDKLVFNPEKSTTEKAVNIIQGTFRYVSGFAVDKQSVDIKTPSGTLGIRGSVVIGLVDPRTPTFIYVAQGVATFANQAGFQELVSGRAVVVTSRNAAPSPSSVIPPQVIAQTIAAILKHLPPVSQTNNRPPLTPKQAERFAAANTLALILQEEQQKKTPGPASEQKLPGGGTLEKELTLLIQAEKLGLLTETKGLTPAQQQFLRDAELVVPNAQAFLTRTKDEQQKFNVANAQLAVVTVLADMARIGVSEKILAEAIIAAMKRQPQFDLSIARALALSSSPQTLLAVLATLMDTAPRLSKQLADAMTNTLKGRHDIPPNALAELTLAIDKAAGESKRTANAGGGGKAGLPGGITKEQALQAILSGKDEGLKLLQKYFDQSGSPKAVVALTNELIDLIKKDPAFKDISKLQAVADQIAKVADESINSAHVLKVGVDPGVTLTGKQHGFEFGPPDLKKFANFESIAPKDPRVTGKDVRGLRRPETAPLLGSGISGVQSVQLKMPNGQYRIILVTGNTGIPSLATAPFGQDVAVNGQSFHVAGGGSPDTWQGLITLGNSGVNALGSDTGGAIVLMGTVTDGVLEVDLNGAPGTTFLAAMVIEPFGEPSIIAEEPSEDTWFDLDIDSRTGALAEIDDAVGTLLSDIATAAGPDQIAQILGLQNPPANPDALSSN